MMNSATHAPQAPSGPLYDYTLSYEENRENAPAESQRLDLEPAQGAGRTLFGMPIGYPIGIPASPLTVNARWIRACAGLGFNVLTYKTVRSRPRRAFPAPNWEFLPALDRPLPVEDIKRVREAPSVEQPENPHAYSMANSFGIPSLSVETWQADVAKALEELRRDQILIVSVVGEYEELEGEDLIDDFVEVARLAEEAGAPIVEVNLSCPNTISDSESSMRRPICETPDDAKLIVERVRNALRPETKLVAKLSYLRKEILADVVSGIAPHVDGIAGINTLQVLLEDRGGEPIFKGTLKDSESPRREGGLSGIAIRDFALSFVRSLAELRREGGWSFEIIGMGGVMDAHDVRALMASGADAVQAATAASNNPGLPAELLNGGTSPDEDDPRLVCVVEAAVEDPRWRYRTIDGIARQLLLGRDRVQHILDEHPEIARKSVMYDREGRELYTAPRGPRGFREQFERLRLLLAR
jgi:dihydroorotate dehydrogenase